MFNFFLFIIRNCASNINFTTFKQWKSSGSWAEREQWTHNSNILMCSSSILCIRKIFISKVLCAAIEEDVMMASDELVVSKRFIFLMILDLSYLVVYMIVIRGLYDC